MNSAGCIFARKKKRTGDKMEGMQIEVKKEEWTVE